MARNPAKYSTLAPLSVLMLTALGALTRRRSPRLTRCRTGPNSCLRDSCGARLTRTATVCVTPAVRSQTTQENQLAASRRDPNGGPYGPDTCLPGYVWRDAFEGDHVCVTPDVRDAAANDNAAAASRLAANQPAPRPSPYRARRSRGPPGWGPDCSHQRTGRRRCPCTYDSDGYVRSFFLPANSHTTW